MLAVTVAVADPTVTSSTRHPTTSASRLLESPLFADNGELTGHDLMCPAHSTSPATPMCCWSCRRRRVR